MKNRSRSPTVKTTNYNRKEIKNMTVKVLFNVTNIVYILIKLEDGQLKPEEHKETLLHKRNEPYTNNYLLKKMKESNYVGYDIKEIKQENIVSEIPYKIALEYKV